MFDELKIEYEEYSGKIEYCVGVMIGCFDIMLQIDDVELPCKKFIQVNVHLLVKEQEPIKKTLHQLITEYRLVQSLQQQAQSQDQPVAEEVVSRKSVCAKSGVASKRNSINEMIGTPSKVVSRESSFKKTVADPEISVSMEEIVCFDVSVLPFTDLKIPSKNKTMFFNIYFKK